MLARDTMILEWTLQSVWRPDSVGGYGIPERGAGVWPARSSIKSSITDDLTTSSSGKQSSVQARNIIDDITAYLPTASRKGYPSECDVRSVPTTPGFALRMVKASPLLFHPLANPSLILGRSRFAQCQLRGYSKSPCLSDVRKCAASKQR